MTNLGCIPPSEAHLSWSDCLLEIRAASSEPQSPTEQRKQKQLATKYQRHNLVPMGTITQPNRMLVRQPHLLQRENTCGRRLEARGELRQSQNPFPTLSLPNTNGLTREIAARKRSGRRQLQQLVQLGEAALPARRSGSHPHMCAHSPSANSPGRGSARCREPAAAAEPTALPQPASSKEKGHRSPNPHTHILCSQLLLPPPRGRSREVPVSAGSASHNFSRAQPEEGGSIRQPPSPSCITSRNFILLASGLEGISARNHQTPQETHQSKPKAEMQT